MNLAYDTTESFTKSVTTTPGLLFVTATERHGYRFRNVSGGGTVYVLEVAPSASAPSFADMVTNGNASGDPVVTGGSWESGNRAGDVYVCTAAGTAELFGQLIQ